ncbi:MAG TPA: tRNA (adenosine(37)-N6)-dimethylallyltransferase MiaA [Geomonas sp.]|nr:tRNA (adenosine(37)-N6)-dimethylallyltransferase MiaA [Geomonas sp.]
MPVEAGKGGYNLLVVLGATASGKTALGVELARRLAGEIISADSRQVYRGMDIGTGKDLHEYGGVPYHLIDVAEPGQEFNLFEFQKHFLNAFQDISQRRKLPLLVGGTGMYLDCILRGYRLSEVPDNPQLRQELAPLSMEELAHRLKQANPALHNSTDLTERPRLLRAIEIAEFTPASSEPWPEIRPLILGIAWERSVQRERITKRLQDRLAAGMIEEVERLHAQGVPWERLEFYGLEYRFLSRYLQGEISRNDLFQKLNSAIHEFAKKQGNWFRRMETHGIRIHWLNGAENPLAEALEVIRVQGETAVSSVTR